MPAATRADEGAGLGRFALLGVWAVVVVVFSIAMPGVFFNWNNFAVLAGSQAPAALLALALVIPLTSGDYDLSVGAVVTLAAMIIGVLNVWHSVPIGWTLLIALAAGITVGAVNAFFIVYFRIPSLVVTLASASFISGIVQWLSNSSTISGISPWLVDVAVVGQLFGITYAFYYALAVAAALWYVFEFTAAGRRLLFVGRGREVARLNGISVARVRVGALIGSSVIAAPYSREEYDAQPNGSGKQAQPGHELAGPKA